MERVYKTMRNAGACSIVIGSVMIVTGLAAGVMAIVSGAALLRRQIRDYILIKGFMLNQKSVARREYACNTLFTMKEKIQNPGKDSFCR